VGTLSLLRLREGDVESVGRVRKHGRDHRRPVTIEQTERAASRPGWPTLWGQRSLIVEPRAAARISAQLRAELVRLGRVDEDREFRSACRTLSPASGTSCRPRNGWELGVRANRRGPINREQYRVLETRDDGGLVVGPIMGGTGTGSCSATA